MSEAAMGKAKVALSREVEEGEVGGRGESDTGRFGTKARFSPGLKYFTPTELGWMRA